MPAGTPGTASAVGERAAMRLAAIDPLLPAPAVSAGCGAELAVRGPDGSTAALGICEHWAGEPGSLALTWGARGSSSHRRSRGRTWPGPWMSCWPGGAIIWLPCPRRDRRIPPPSSRGPPATSTDPGPSCGTDLAPRAVIAARASGRRAATTVPVGPGVPIRQAGPADLDEVVRFGLETIRYDAHFGTVIERPETPAALRHEAGAVLAAPDPWVWLAERDGTPIGLLDAERPELAGWIAPMVRAAPVAYLELMDVLPGERGRGVAAALTGQLHQAAGESGVAVMLLHYEQVNPLSGPFWNQQGYRPLWTSWEARRASTLR